MNILCDDLLLKIYSFIQEPFHLKYVNKRWHDVLDPSNAIYSLTYTNYKIRAFSRFGTLNSYISDFKNLQCLYFNDCNLMDIPFIFPPSLKILDFSGNRILSFKVPDSVVELNCSRNYLQFIELGSNLRILRCDNNMLTSLNLPPSLLYLDCSFNNIKNLKLPENLEFANLNYVDSDWHAIALGLVSAGGLLSVEFNNSIKKIKCIGLINAKLYPSLDEFKNLVPFDKELPIETYVNNKKINRDLVGARIQKFESMKGNNCLPYCGI